jgi:hypothetical protein
VTPVTVPISKYFCRVFERHLEWYSVIAPVVISKGTVHSTQKSSIKNHYTVFPLNLQAAKTKNQNDLTFWAPSLRNHFWYCSKNCEKDAKKFKVGNDLLLITVLIKNVCYYSQVQHW